MINTIHCKNASDKRVIQIILEGNDFITQEDEPNRLTFTNRSNPLGTQLYPLPWLQTGGKDNVFTVFVPVVILDVTEIDEYLREIERLRNVMEEIAIQAGEEYVTHP